MVVLTDKEKIIFFMGRKAFGYRRADKEGLRSYAEAQAENPDAGFYRLRPYEGQILHERLPFYRPYNPQTLIQQARRVIFASGVLFWRTLTTEQKLEWKKKGEKRRLPGWHTFMSDYLLTH